MKIRDQSRHMASSSYWQLAGLVLSSVRKRTGRMPPEPAAAASQAVHHAPKYLRNKEAAFLPLNPTV